ncbi:hypothetical protein ACN2CC_04945 [Mesorhizobium muleiense]|uniref:hypothetical protein n=1 Tax=Mesorhizobium muleiense TaxID=1004279 RepID=UPI003AFA0CAA
MSDRLRLSILIFERLCLQRVEFIEDATLGTPATALIGRTALARLLPQQRPTLLSKIIADPWNLQFQSQRDKVAIGK